MKITQEGTNFKVLSDTNQEYIVTLEPITCTCCSFKFRNSKNGDFCKHIKEVINLVTSRVPKNTPNYHDCKYFNRKPRKVGKRWQ